MFNKFLTAAKMGEPVYISTVYDSLQQLEATKRNDLHLVLTLLENNEQRLFKLALPKLEDLDEESLNFTKSYLWAEIYNILSSLGGTNITAYIDLDNQRLKAIVEELNTVFDVSKRRDERRGYGRCINVIDRMLDTLAPNTPSFSFCLEDIDLLPSPMGVQAPQPKDARLFQEVTQHLENKIICGIDVGGTDIKVVAVKNGEIDCYKEYDWFPAKFTQSHQLIDPILMIVRLIRLKLSLDTVHICDEKHLLKEHVEKALKRDATDAFILDTIERIDAFLDHIHIDIDAIGLCFPDVVVKNKVVGGEVYKTRGIRNNPDIEYEYDFKRLTDLNDRLKDQISKEGTVELCNDGPMASFTAAVELAALGNLDTVKEGVFAHTLGTELGTGWVEGDGNIPDIPLEVYNYIIDLGSYDEKGYPSDDLRSINNFNTDLPGTLQKYCSQSGVFRLAMKYFPKERPDLYQELFDLGYVKVVTVDGTAQLIVPTEPVDMRKAFLEHMMALPEREKDDVNNRIWTEIGEFLAVTCMETDKILAPAATTRYLFGRLVKRPRCFELMVEGAKSILPDIKLEVADSSMAVTPLMKKLEADPDYTVAQFAQAIGAVYYANRI